MTERFEHKKSLGQHFLNSDYVPKHMCDAAALSNEDTVVEVGPGTGALTVELLARGCRVIALETDPRAIDALQQRFPEALASKQLTLIDTDVRHLDLATLGPTTGDYKVVANIPYYLSGRLFRTFLDSDYQPSVLVFLIQKELAERIARDPKESLLSLSVKAFGTPQYVTTVKRGHFTPPPKVDSAIIAVRDISHSFFKNFEKALFFKVIKAGFASKRKQLAPNLRDLYPVDTSKQALEAIGLPATSRAEDLSLSHWSQLLTKLSSTI
jgi:16S rRNA (adenine1518-N6/adenine1519-N6)-dimethyltransferase